MVSESRNSFHAVITENERRRLAEILVGLIQPDLLIGYLMPWGLNPSQCRVAPNPKIPAPRSPCLPTVTHALKMPSQLRITSIDEMEHRTDLSLLYTIAI